MELSNEGIELIKKFEGCRLQVYLDVGGLPTVGYGHRTDMLEGETITQEMADTLLMTDLMSFSNGTKTLLGPAIICNDNQFSSLVCFAYNLGLGTLQNSTLLKKVKEGDYEGASREFLKWVHVGPHIVPGLVARRQAEKELFEKPVTEEIT
jgi:lysozyme